MASGDRMVASNETELRTNFRAVGAAILSLLIEHKHTCACAGGKKRHERKSIVFLALF